MRESGEDWQNEGYPRRFESPPLLSFYLLLSEIAILSLLYSIYFILG